MSEEINLNIIDIKDMEAIIKKDVENGKAVVRLGGKEIKVGIIKKCSFEPVSHMIVKVGDEDIWLEGPIESFQKGDYKEGVKIDIKGKHVGTISGDCDFGKIGVLPLYVADYVRINDKNDKETKIGKIKQSSFDEDGIHAIVIIGNEEIFVEGHIGTFEKGDYTEGTQVEMIGRDFGTIVGEWEFGDLDILPLFNIEHMKIIEK